MPVVSDFGFTMRPSRRELVLVVAEDASLRGALVARLQEDGYSVLSASGPEEAMAMLVVTRASVLVAATPRLDALRPEHPIPLVVVDEQGVDQISESVAAAIRSQRPAG